MRYYYDIKLNDHSLAKRDLEGESIVKAGRYLIAKTLLELGAATVDPLSPDNPLIFSAGPFSGTSFSNANRTSVGCKSPLTGGVKEANGGGTFSYGLGHHKIAGFTLHGASPDWVVIHFKKDGTIHFDDAKPYMGQGNFEAQSMLHAHYDRELDGSHSKHVPEPTKSAPHGDIGHVRRRLQIAEEELPAEIIHFETRERSRHGPMLNSGLVWWRYTMRSPLDSSTPYLATSRTFFS